jgi:hypothetical protein
MICKRCGLEKLPHEMYFDKGYVRCCKECENKKRREQYQEIRERTLAINRRSRFKNKYGITPEEYELMELHQFGCCAICKKPRSEERLCVDHDHSRNVIRGLLCRNCNRILGLLNEDEELILNIIDYLKRTTWKDEVA